LLALLVALQVLLSRDEPLELRLTVQVSGRSGDGEPVDWQATVHKAGGIYLNGNELGRDEPNDLKRPPVAMAELLRHIDSIEPPIRIEVTNSEIEEQWQYEQGADGRGRMDDRRASAEDVKAKLVALRKTQDQWPTARLDVRLSGRPAEGRKVSHMFAIGAEGQATLDDLPSTVEQFMALVDSPWQSVAISGRVSDSGWTAEMGANGVGARRGRAVTLDEIKSELKTFVLDEKVKRTVSPTVQDVLDLVADGTLPPFTYTQVDLPGFPYKTAYPEATDEPEVVINRYSGHPMFEDSEKMPDSLKGFYPEPLPPVTERLPRNPAVLWGCDGIGRYSKTTTETYLDDCMVWRRATADSPVALYRKVGYPALVRFDGGGRLQPNLAWKWEVSPDNRVFTFYLRKGHRWSDGKPFTTDDMLFSLNMVCGSPAWGQSPLWMQETDGSNMIYVDDIRDWPALAKRLLDGAGDAAPSMGRQMLKVINAELPEALDELVASDKLPEKKAVALKALLVPKGPEAAVALAALPEKAFAERFAAYRLTPRETGYVGAALGGIRLFDLMDHLKTISPEALPDERTRARIVSRLNSVLSSRRFYDAATWRDVDVASDLKALLARGFSRLNKGDRYRVQLLMRRNHRLTRTDTIFDTKLWRAGDVSCFNVLMFRAANADIVAPAERRRVKVEAVADATGDTSHIIRFTFPKPSSIFLESCATFMVYLGMAGRQRAFSEKYHMDGVQEMLVFDVMKWEAWFEAMKAEFEAGGTSPGRHIWPMIREELRAQVIANPPSNTRPAEDDLPRQEAIAAEMNRLLHRRDFYNAEAWEHVDLDSELKKLLTDEPDKKEADRKKGYSRLQDRDRRRVDYLMRRADFLRRGVEDLSDDEVLQMNLMMLRVAYDGATWRKKDDPKKMLLAPDREVALDEETEARGHRRLWTVLFNEMRAYKRGKNEHVPTLCPWRIVSEKDDQRIIAVRNPYYFKVDAEGQQLPYIDVVIDERAKRKEIRQIKLRSGQINFQTRGLEFDDFTALKQMEGPGGYEVRLWPNDYVGEMTFIICQQHADDEYRKIQGDPRFHQALSLGLNRQEMIDVVWHGMGRPAQFSMPKGSPYYSEKLFNAYAEYDPERANRLLDEMGLRKRNREGVRLLPSGRPFHLEVNTEEERPRAGVELAVNYWRKLGINAQMKMRSGPVKWRMYSTGKWDIWVHKEGGNYWGPLDGGTVAPCHPASSVHISRWTAWLRSGGRIGVEPPDHIKDLDYMWQKVLTAPNDAEKFARWQELMDRTARELPALGVMTSPGKVVLVKNNFKNVPNLALAGWIAHDPGNCNPEVFYVEMDD
jgi:ABC-type transport system substrate-binding protein